MHTHISLNHHHQQLWQQRHILPYQQPIHMYVNILCVCIFIMC
jgi:hypothetical protein